MSEKFTPRIDNWDANKAAHEKAQFEDEIYGEAGVSDFSDEARRRAEEGDTYSQHMEGLLGRSDDYDPEQSQQLDAIDRTIESSAELRRMKAMATSIAAEAATGKDTSEREDKLQELILDYQENGAAHEAEKDEIFERIINMTRQEVVATETSPEEANGSQVIESNDAEQPVDDNQIETAESDNQEERLPKISAAEISAKRAEMVRSGLNALGVGNMSNDEISAYNLVESQPEDAKHGEGDSEQDVSPDKSDVVVQDTLPGLDNIGAESSGDLKVTGSTDNSADDLEILDVADEAVSADDLELIDEGDSSATPTRLRDRLRSVGKRARSRASLAGLGAEYTTWAAARAEMNGERSRKSKVARGLGAAALLIGGGLLMMKGHDVFGGNGPGSNGGGGIPTPDTLNTGTPGVVHGPEYIAPSGSFTVEPGHGLTHEWMDWGKNRGQNISPEKAYQLHEHLTSVFGKEGMIDLDGLSKSSETYTQNGDIRISAPGTANWRSGVEAEAVKWLNANK